MKNINSASLPMTIKFKLNHPEKVLLEIYDLDGKCIQTMVNATLDVRSHQYSFDGEAFPAGIYFYRLQVGEHVESGKLILANDAQEKTPKNRS